MKTKFIKFFVTALFAGSLFSCIEMPLSNALVENQPTDDWSKLGIPKSFTFDSLTKVVKVKVMINGTNVFDSRNNVIAENLPVGDYVFTIPQFEKLVMKTPVSLKSANSYSNFTYSKFSYGTFVVEDTYPYGGDFDYNDVAFEYIIKETRMKVFSNPVSDYIDTCEIIISPIAMGVGAFNTYGLIAHVKIGNSTFKVSGGKFYNTNFDKLDYASNPIYKDYSMFTFNPDSTESNVHNGLESNQKSGEIIPITDDLTRTFGDYFHFYDRLFINSNKIDKVAKPIKITLSSFSNPRNDSILVQFSVINNIRKNEIPYMTTNGNIDDAMKHISTPLTLNLPFCFKCPRENVPFWAAYPQFLDWAKSDGKMNKDWMNYPINGLIVK